MRRYEKWYSGNGRRIGWGLCSALLAGVGDIIDVNFVIMSACAASENRFRVRIKFDHDTETAASLLAPAPDFLNLFPIWVFRLARTDINAPHCPEHGPFFDDGGTCAGGSNELDGMSELFIPAPRVKRGQTRPFHRITALFPVVIEAPPSC